MIQNIKEFIFNVGYTISLVLDLIIVDKLKIELKHSYSRKKYYPGDDYWKANGEVNEVLKKGTFILVLFDYDKVAFQDRCYGMSSQENIDEMVQRFYAKMESYVVEHTYFSLSTKWKDYYLKKLLPVKIEPLTMFCGGDCKQYKCYESDETI